VAVAGPGQSTSPGPRGDACTTNRGAESAQPARVGTPPPYGPLERRDLMENTTRSAGPACPGYTIRRLRPEDAAGVATCVRRVYGDSYVLGQFGSPLWQSSSPRCESFARGDPGILRRPLAGLAWRERVAPCIPAGPYLTTIGRSEKLSHGSVQVGRSLAANAIQTVNRWSRRYCLGQGLK
jgi:hypothetical protein